MLGWFVLIYLVLGIALTVFCEVKLNIFDEVIDLYKDVYELELKTEISKMFVKGLLQFMYAVLWWLVLIVTAIYVYNNR